MYNKAVLLQTLQQVRLKVIDTLKLMLSDYEVSPESSLRVQPASYEVATGEKVEFPLFRNEAGTFYGSKAYLNTENWNLTLKPLPAGTRGVGAFLQFSVPKNYYGSNYFSVGEAGTRAALKKVEGELDQSGVFTNLEEAELSRVDTFKNIEPEEPFSSYFSLFSLLKARKAQQRGYGTTFLVSNSSQEFCVYDKLQEMREHGLETSELPETMRFEHRALKKEKVRSLYGFTSVSELFHGGYEVVKEKQVESWKNSLFSFSAEEVVVLGSKQLEQEMKVFQERFGSNWFQYFLRSYGAYSLAKFAGKEVVRAALENLNSERTKVWRTMKLLEEAERELLVLKQEEGSSKTLGELYEELRGKVCELAGRN